MTRKQTYRYKCDFCGKTGYSGGHMRKHEKHCTANDNRECRVCKMIEVDQKPIGDLVAAAWLGLKALEDAAEGCPACILAAIRRLPPLHGPASYEDGDQFSRWKFKPVMQSIWDDINHAQAERDGYY